MNQMMQALLKAKVVDGDDVHRLTRQETIVKEYARKQKALAWKREKAEIQRAKAEEKETRRIRANAEQLASSIN